MRSPLRSRGSRAWEPECRSRSWAAGGEPGALVCTVLAFDHLGAFSLIAGVLSAMGFNILSGDIFTWAPPDERTPRDGALRRKRIIDQLTVTGAGAAEDETWLERLSATLAGIFAALEQGGEAAARARQTVNEMAAEKLADLKLEAQGVLYPVRIELGFDGSPVARTRMRVKAQDTPFFLYAFSTALSLQDVSIESVIIRTEQGRIEDELELVDGAGRPITDQSRLDGIKLSVLLTKQFTSFLGSASDPLAALLRFEQLVKDIVSAPGQARWVELLSSQSVLRDLAQLLGASSFLWEDFVRLQYEELIPLLGPGVPGKSLVEPLELLPERLEMALAGAANPEELRTEAERVQGQGNLSLRSGPHPCSAAQVFRKRGVLHLGLPHAEQAAHGACGSGGRRGGLMCLAPARREIRTAAHRCRAAGEARHHGAREARRCGPGVRIRHRASVRVQRQRLHGGPGGHRQR